MPGSNLTNFEFMVMLVLIRLDEEAYGVPISREMEKQAGRAVAVGSVYAALERLQRRGFVSSRLGEPTVERGGRAKRYFRVTRSGLRVVRELRKAFVKLWQDVPVLEGGR